MDTSKVYVEHDRGTEEWRLHLGGKRGWGKMGGIVGKQRQTAGKRRRNQEVRMSSGAWRLNCDTRSLRKIKKKKGRGKEGPIELQNMEPS